MKTVIILNDNTPADIHAAAFGLLMAHAIQAKVLVCHTAKAAQPAAVPVLAGGQQTGEKHSIFIDQLMSHLTGHCQLPHGFDPQIEETAIADFTGPGFAGLVFKNNVHVIIKGLKHGTDSSLLQKRLEAYSFLNRSQCPLMVIPEDWQLKPLERLVYITDLRYCRLAVAKYLAGMADAFQASLTIAHLSAKGLPHLMEPYAHELFTTSMGKHLNYTNVYFNNITERDVMKAVDVMINGMHNDLVVLVNRRFHFTEIIGDYLGHMLPGHIPVPLLIIPY